MAIFNHMHRGDYQNMKWVFFYRALIRSNCKDDWLFPVWASSVNPHHRGSKSFIDLAIREDVYDEWVREPHGAKNNIDNYYGLAEARPKTLPRQEIRQLKHSYRRLGY